MRRPTGSHDTALPYHAGIRLERSTVCRPTVRREHLLDLGVLTGVGERDDVAGLLDDAQGRGVGIAVGGWPGGIEPATAV